MNKIKLKELVSLWKKNNYLAWIRYDWKDLDIDTFDVDDVINSSLLEFSTNCESCKDWVDRTPYMWEWFWWSKDYIFWKAKDIVVNIMTKKELWLDYSEETEKINILRNAYNLLLNEKSNADSYKYIVNITTKNKKQVATIIESNPNDSVELDFDRGDRGFNIIEEAQEYANTFNL